MDLYKYINSSAVAKHLRKANYHPSTLESVWIVFEINNITLSEKLAALGYILMMPDEKRYSHEFPKGYSVHAAIRDYFDYFKNIFIEFTTQDDNCYYEASIKNTLVGDWDPRSHCFSSCKAALDHLNKLFEIGLDLEVEIRKCSIDQRVDMFFAQFRGGELRAIHKRGGKVPLRHLLKGKDTVEIYHPQFPIPFKPGDILCDKAQHRIVVLDNKKHIGGMPTYYYYSHENDSVIVGSTQFFTDLEYHLYKLPHSHSVLYEISRHIQTGEIIASKEDDIKPHPSSYSYT